MKISARNQLNGTVKNIETGLVTAKVQVDVNGTNITSIISKEAIEDLGLKVGDSVQTLIKSTSVMLMK